MAIPESQLETWAHQGSVTQSSETYQTIRRALLADGAGYSAKPFEVFLQGSYGNNTNIYAESDVDIVICYNGAFFHDLTELPPDQRSAFSTHFSDATYYYATFKQDVQTVLDSAFGRSVKPGGKAIKIEANGSRRNADVIVAFEFRRYHRFIGVTNQSFDTGVCFFKQDGTTRIANYPKYHSENCTAKHQATCGNFKPLVRIFKNIRTKLVDDGVIEGGVAPSYFIEGLLYNVPPEHFSGTYDNMVVKAVNWLHSADRTEFVCANRQYYLLRDSPVCWTAVNCQRYIDAVTQLWNEW